MTTATVWTLTVDDSDGIATTVHPSEAAAMIALRDNYSELELPDDDGELVDYLTHSTWEGGPGIVFYIESHDIDVGEALEYLHTHAGYTRVHNPVSGRKDLVRLPGLVAAAYQHETSRAGDPHLHTHVLVPNKQARTDGVLVAIDSDALWHEAKPESTDGRWR